MTTGGACALVIALVSGCPPTRSPRRRPDAPRTKRAGEPSPSQILKHYPLHAPPPLASGDQVASFLDWAGASHVDEREDGRKVIAAAAGNPEVVQALIDEVEHVQAIDHTRALLALAVLGETRSPLAQQYFTGFVHRPLPNEGTVIEGEIIEETRAAQLQAKAVDGLAYVNTESADKVVMDVIASHPSKIVRAEAVNAYLWNHGDSTAAQRMLSQFVRKDEAILIDRVRRVTGETAQTFNAKLAEFLKQHPELAPPPPEKSEAAARPAGQHEGTDVKPPVF